MSDRLEKIKTERPIYGLVEYMDGEVAALVEDQEWLVGEVERLRERERWLTAERVAALEVVQQARRIRAIFPKDGVLGRAIDAYDRLQDEIRDAQA